MARQLAKLKLYQSAYSSFGCCVVRLHSIHHSVHCFMLHLPKHCININIYSLYCSAVLTCSLTCSLSVLTAIFQVNLG